MVEFKNRLLNIFRNVTQSIAFYPTLIALGFTLFALGMLYAENFNISDWLAERARLLVIRDESTARSVVSTITGGLISLMVFSFSMVMLLLNQASSNFSPRLLPGLISNKRHQFVLGTYLGTIIYGIIILMNVHPNYKVYGVPGVSITVLVLMAIYCLALFIYFINNISKNIQVTQVLHALHQKTRRKLLQLREEDSKRLQPIESVPDTDPWYDICTDEGGYVQNIAFQHLVEIGERTGTVFKMQRFRGEFVVEGLPLLRSRKQLSGEVLDEVLSCISLSTTDAVSDHYLHGFKQITEIAVKAMSPGINDPGTALNVIDYLTQLFTLRMQIEETRYFQDESNKTRLYLQPIPFSDLLYYIMADMRQYCRHDPVVMIKLLTMFRLLLQQDRELKKYQQILIREANALLADARKHIDNETDLERIEQMGASLQEINSSKRRIMV